MFRNLIRTSGFAELLVPGQPPARGPNQIQFGYKEAVARSLADPNNTYAARMLYVEFANVADPEDTISPPVGFSQEEGVEYYASLSAEVDRDYLRIPVLSARVFLNDEYDGIEANAVTLMGEALPDSEGIHGLTFSLANNSLVYGLAIIVAPILGDPSSDIVIARKYYDSGDQRICPSNGSMTIKYTLNPGA